MLIEVDTHCHSIASTHAYSTVKEIAASAREIGLKGFALTDHAPSFNDAPHLWHFHNLRCLPRKINGVTIIRGVEASISDSDGNLDMPPEECRLLEWIIASVHLCAYTESIPADFSEVYINMAKNNPHVDVVGHCTTDDTPFEYERVLKTFKEYGKLVEINESSIINKRGSAKHAVEVLKICKKHEIPVVVNTDSHFCDLIGVISNSEAMINELEFPQRLIANSDINAVAEFIRRKKPGFSLE